MLMVVLQHTIARCYADYSSTFLFNAIWSLQMPFRRIVLFGVEMSASLLIIRYLTSICGCLSLICLVNFSHRYLLPFAKAGLYSLQIYLVHYLFLAPLTIGASEKLNLLTLSGFTVVSVNYLLTIGLVILSINLIKNNSYLNKLLFWK